LPGSRTDSRHTNHHTECTVSANIVPCIIITRLDIHFIASIPPGYVESPIAAARAPGNTLEARNGFYGPETRGLMCFQVLIFKNLGELQEFFFFLVRRRVNKDLEEMNNLRRSCWGCAKPHHSKSHPSYATRLISNALQYHILTSKLLTF
jgi:hypothetical protein